MKRIGAGLAWTFVLMWAGNYVALYTGLPAFVTGFVAVAVGTFVATDPFRLIWPAAAARSVRPTTPPGVATDGPARA